MKEGNPHSGEQTGRNVRNVGIVIGVIGLLSSIELFVGGTTLAVSGEIYRRAKKPK